MAYFPLRNSRDNANANNNTTYTRQRTHGSISPEDATLDSNLNLIDNDHDDRYGNDNHIYKYNNVDSTASVNSEDRYDGIRDTHELYNNINIGNNYFNGNGMNGEMDDTDEFGREILRQAREDERMRDGRDDSVDVGDGNGYRSSSGDGAPGSENRRKTAFRKARTHPGVFERLGRDIGTGERDFQSERVRKRRRDGSGKLNLGGLNSDEDIGKEVAASGDSDASASAAVRKPREWGRKGRRGNEWLRAIKMDDGDGDGGVLHGYTNHIDTNGQIGEESILQNDWNAIDADDPMPTVEDSPLSKKGSQQTTPLALKLENTSLDKIRQWEMTDDLTFGSLITSTPAVPSRRKEQKNTMLDDIKRMEIENVKEMAITKSQLNKIRETSPEEQREKERKPSEARLSKHQQGQNWKNRRRSKQEEQEEKMNNHVRTNTTIPSNIRSYKQSPKKESHNPTSPIMVYKYSEAFSEVDRETQAKAQLKSPKSNSRRQHDSHNLLRKLARATSNSSSPAATLPADAGIDVRSPRRTKEIEVQNDALSAHTQRNTKKKSPLAKAASTIELAFKSALATPIKDMPEHDKQDRDVNQRFAQPNATNQLIVAKTPVVTGAWIDTPVPYRSGPAYLPTPAPDPVLDATRQPKSFKDQNYELKRRIPHPSDERQYPKSALAAVIEKVKGAKYKYHDDALANIADENDENGYGYNQELDHLGDSTIQSLEELISPIDDEQNNGTLTKLDEDTLRNLELPTEPPRTRAEKQRYQELVTLKEMQSRLDAARTSIRDASRSIKRVEQQVETRDDNGGSCSKCGCPGSGIGARGLVIGNPWPLIKRLLTRTTTTNGSSGQERRKLTWLGWIVVPLLCWYLSEVILSHFYGPPLYAHRMVGYGVDPLAPRPPYITITLLTRPWSWLWRPLLSLAKWLVRLCMTAVYGYLADLGLIGAGAVRYSAGSGAGAGAGAGVNSNTWRSIARETHTFASGSGGGGGYVPGVADDYDDHDWSMMDDEYV